MPPGMKTVILESRTGNFNDGKNNHSKNVYKPVKTPSYPTSILTIAQLHQLLTELISESSLSEKNDVDDNKDEPAS